MRYFNQQVYRKTYILEFQSQKSVDAIAFSVPAQSENIEFPQRIGETKTFGGTVIEDYGNDAGKITITGTTVNNSMRLIYQGDKGLAIRNGEEEVFYINNLIQKYGQIKNLKNKKVYLTELNGINRSSNKHWEVAITNFQLKRSKDKPMSYEYTLSCTISNNPELEKKYKLGSIKGCMDAINGFLSAIYQGVNFLETGLLYYRAGLNVISNLRNSVQLFEEICQSYTDTINGFIDSTAEYITETVGFVDQVIKSAERIVLGQPAQIWESCQNVNKAARDMVDYFEHFPENDISEDLLNQFGTTTTEMIDTWKKESKEVQSDVEATVTITKQMLDSYTPLVVPGDDSTDDEIVLTNGYILITVSDGDTWDSLAEKYFGDASLGSTLAAFNAMNSDDLTAGTKILIPNLNPSDNNDNNNVQNPYGIHDNKGKDISGKFADNQGDLSVEKGNDNLSQQISSRLQTSLDSRTRLEVYGIRSAIGDDNASLAFLYSSINKTILADPRVKSIEEISVVGEGNNVQIAVDYTDIDNNQNTYKGNF